MKASREEIKDALKEWNLAWDNHDLDGVMQLFHDEILFENNHQFCIFSHRGE